MIRNGITIGIEESGMTIGEPASRKSPHLTPAKLFGEKFPPQSFPGVTTAVVGYCPRPGQLDRYQPKTTPDQYFIHLPPASVELCQYRGIPFLSLTHVYGGPVSAATIEELAYYGIQTVLAYGLAGGLGTRNLKMGDFYLVEKALVRDGATPHYTNAAVVGSDPALNSAIQRLAAGAGLPVLTPVQALTSDAIYREYDENLADAREQGCDIVNCDSSHLFAVSRAVGIRSTECGVLSDVAQGSGDEWQSQLSAMLSGKSGNERDPLVLAGSIAEFYIEFLLPELSDHQAESF
jgi:uridine phosphorylase